MKSFKKKSRYKAYLRTENIEKEFKLPKQWALFHIRPTRAILYLDSLMYTTETGDLALSLSVGKHPFKIISPFYEELADTLTLTDSVRFEKDFILKPYFAYLTVETKNPDACILLDHKEIGRGRAETARLRPGRYQLMVTLGNQLCYAQEITLASTEKKTIAIDSLHEVEKVHSLTEVEESERKEDVPAHAQMKREHLPSPVSQNEILSDVTVKAFNSETEIWINREKRGTGSWQGKLAPGFYCLSSQKEGIDSRTFYFWVEKGKALDLNLKSPLADYGMLDVSSNLINAIVFLNGIIVGKTPCVIQHLPIDRSYHVIVVKDGIREDQIVHIKPNDITHVRLNLK